MIKGTIYDDSCNMKVDSNRISADDKICVSNSYEEQIQYQIYNNKSIWNDAICTMMEVIELQPLINQSAKERIKEIAKGLMK